jgi:hypothetical protein
MGVAIAVLVGIAWLIVRGIEKEPALVGSLLTAASAVVAVGWSRNLDRKAEAEQARREQMWPRYAELIERVRTATEEQDPEESAKFWKDLATALILYAPPAVIDAQLRLSRHFLAIADPTVPEREAMLLLDRLYRAIRADLGHDDKKLAQGNLLRLYITDIDTLIGPFKPMT